MVGTASSGRGRPRSVGGKAAHIRTLGSGSYMERSRSLGLAITRTQLVQEAARLFDADFHRTAYVPESGGLLVSPFNSRAGLAKKLKPEGVVRIDTGGRSLTVILGDSGRYAVLD